MLVTLRIEMDQEFGGITHIPPNEIRFRESSRLQAIAAVHLKYITGGKTSKESLCLWSTTTDRRGENQNHVLFDESSEFFSTPFLTFSVISSYVQLTIEP